MEKGSPEKGSLAKGNSAEKKPFVLNLPSGTVEKHKKEWLISSNGMSFSKETTQNCSQEEEALEVAEDFRRQFIQLFPNRRPLLLFPANEAGIPKVLSTTLTPSLQPHDKLYTVEECATFVSDFLDYYPLDSPVKLPQMIPSSAAVIKLRAGDCFDFSVFLCSLLMGAGYDAYCVNGYAPKFITEVDQKNTMCPEHVKFPRGKPAEGKNKSDEKDKSYKLKVKREHDSKFLTNKQNKEEEMAERLVERKKVKIREAVKKPIDEHEGNRVHAWVLVKTGSRDVKESFFVEPTSGIIYPIKGSPYVGIESVWNDKNIWINVQNVKDQENTSLNFQDRKKMGASLSPKEGEREDEGELVVQCPQRTCFGENGARES